MTEIDIERINQALYSCGRLLATICRDEIGDVAKAELEYAQEAFASLILDRNEWQGRAADRCHEAEEWFRKYGEQLERVTMMKEALKPFAETSERFDNSAAYFGAGLTPDQVKPRTDFTHGQLRAARRAYEYVDGK